MQLKNLPWELLFDLPNTELPVYLHVFTKQHHVDGSSNTEQIRLIRPGPIILHLSACEAVSLNDL